MLGAVAGPPVRRACGDRHGWRRREAFALPWPPRNAGRVRPAPPIPDHRPGLADGRHGRTPHIIIPHACARIGSADPESLQAIQRVAFGTFPQHQGCCGAKRGLRAHRPAEHLCTANRAIVPFPVWRVRHRVSAKGMAGSVRVVWGKGISLCWHPPLPSSLRSYVASAPRQIMVLSGADLKSIFPLNQVAEGQAHGIAFASWSRVRGRRSCFS